LHAYAAVDSLYLVEGDMTGILSKILNFASSLRATGATPIFIFETGVSEVKRATNTDRNIKRMQNRALWVLLYKAYLSGNMPDNMYYLLASPTKKELVTEQQLQDAQTCCAQTSPFDDIYIYIIFLIIKLYILDILLLFINIV